MRPLSQIQDSSWSGWFFRSRERGLSSSSLGSPSASWKPRCSLQGAVFNPCRLGASSSSSLIYIFFSDMYANVPDNLERTIFALTFTSLYISNANQTVPIK